MSGSGASYPAGVTSVYGEELGLSTVLASLGSPGIETKQAIVYVPNYDFRMHVNPAITEALFYDASASAGARFKKTGATNALTTDLTNRSSTGTGTLLDAATTSDRLYIGVADVIGGLRVDMTSSVNTNTASITVNYWNGSWTSISPTDGTVVGGKSLSKDGSITWTAPSDWVSAHLGGTSFDGGVMGMGITDTDAPASERLWLQIYWSAALSADVEIANLWTLNRNTNRGYFEGGVRHYISFDARKTGAIEALLETDKIPSGDSTDTMEITWIKTII